ncbi:MAG: Tetratricopeptide repeat [Pseudomonadota bacterium]|jgi:tetratricopeptide (TPR) repeat protein
MTEAALQRARAMVERFPDRAPPHFSLARALHDLGRFDEAQQAYARAAELQPDLMMAWLHRGECLLELQRAEEARSCAEQARALARSQGHSGPLGEAEELLELVADFLDS